MSMVLAAQSLPTVLIAIPVVVACVLIAVGRYLPRSVVDGMAMSAALAGVALAVSLIRATADGQVISWSGGWRPRPGVTVGIVLVADRISAAAVLLIAVLTVCALLFGWRYFESVHAHYHALVLLFAAGMTGFALTGDLFDMFVFFELMGAAGYALAGFKIEEPESVHGALTFAVINSLGAYLCLVGIGLLYARTGQLGLAQISTALAGRQADPLVLAAFVLIATGWLVKAAAVPFHFWLADAHTVAPTPVCVLFSGIMAPLGVYGVARVYWVVFHGVLDTAAHRAFLVLGVLTAVVGATMCFIQRHIKRMLAYSTIAHIGLFLVGLAALSPLGISGAGIYIAGHAGVKGALFLLAGTLLNRYRSVDELDLHGRARSYPVYGMLFLLGALALAGLPPFGTGLGKALIEDSAEQTWVTALVLVVSSVTGAAAFRVGLRVYFGLGPKLQKRSTLDTLTGEEAKPDIPGLRPTTKTMAAAVVLLLGFGLAIGIVPGISRASGTAATMFTDQRGYIEHVLNALARTTAATPPDTAWSTSGVMLGLLSAVMATVLGTCAVYAPCLPDAIRRRARIGQPVFSGLHRLHSGHLGDYAAWLLFGTATLAAITWLS